MPASAKKPLPLSSRRTWKFRRATRCKSQAFHPAVGYRAPRHLRLINIALYSLAALAIAALAYVLLWFLLADATRENIALWAKTLRAEGYALDYSEIEMSGFPFLVRAHMPAPSITLPDTRGPWAWRGQFLDIEIAPWNWNRFVFRTSGRQHVELPVHGRRTSFDGAAEDISINITLADRFPRDIVLDFTGLFLAQAEGDPDITLGRLQGRLHRLLVREGAPPLAKLVLKGQDITFRGGLFLPLGTEPASFAVRADIKGPLPKEAKKAAIKAWRDAGGLMEVRHLKIHHGPLEMVASGTIAPDSNMQPAGSFIAKISGFFEAVRTLERRGFIRGRDALAARVIFGMFSNYSKDNGRRSISLPITVQSRKLYVGQVPLLTFDPISWPEDTAPTSTPGAGDL